MAKLENQIKNLDNFYTKNQKNKVYSMVIY